MVYRRGAAAWAVWLCACAAAPAPQPLTSEVTIDDARATKPSPQTSELGADAGRMLQERGLFMLGSTRNRSLEVQQAVTVLRDCTARDACSDRVVLERFWVPRRIKLTVGSSLYHDVSAVPDVVPSLLFTTFRHLEADESAAGTATDAYEGHVVRAGQPHTLCLWVTWGAHEPTYRIDLEQQVAGSAPRCAPTPPPATGATLPTASGQRLRTNREREMREVSESFRAEPPLPTQLSADAVAQSFTDTEPLVRDCAVTAPEELRIDAEIFGWLGKAFGVRVSGTGKADAACIQRAVGFARFPLFAGPKQTVSHTFMVSPE
jgi:hypothetical protein